MNFSPDINLGQTVQACLTFVGLLTIYWQLKFQNRQVLTGQQQLINNQSLGHAQLLVILSQEASKHDEICKLLFERNKKHDISILSDADLYKVRLLLRFFETVMLVLKTGTLTVDEAFTAFAYRIFVAIEDSATINAYLRETDTHPQQTFHAVFALHNTLINYISKIYKEEGEITRILRNYGVNKKQSILNEAYYDLAVKTYNKHHNLTDIKLERKLLH